MEGSLGLLLFKKGNSVEPITEIMMDTNIGNYTKPDYIIALYENDLVGKMRVPGTLGDMIKIKLGPEDYPKCVSSTVKNLMDNCSICMDKMEEGDKLFCGHIFHEDCIREWLTKESVKCPVCQTDVRGFLYGLD